MARSGNRIVFRKDILCDTKVITLCPENINHERETSHGIKLTFVSLSLVSIFFFSFSKVVVLKHHVFVISQKARSLEPKASDHGLTKDTHIYVEK